METDNMNVAQVVLRKYLRNYEPFSEGQGTRNEEQGRVVVKTSEDIIRELADIVEIEINDVVAVMLAEGYDLLRRNEVYGWAMRGNGEHCV